MIENDKGAVFRSSKVERASFYVSKQIDNLIAETEVIDSVMWLLFLIDNANLMIEQCYIICFVTSPNQFPSVMIPHLPVGGWDCDYLKHSGMTLIIAF